MFLNHVNNVPLHGQGGEHLRRLGSIPRLSIEFELVSD